MNLSFKLHMCDKAEMQEFVNHLGIYIAATITNNNQHQSGESSGIGLYLDIAYKHYPQVDL